MHVSKLRLMRKDLASMGHAPGDDELYVIILGSLPYSFKPFISALNATSSVLETILLPNDLMQAFTSSDWQGFQNPQGSGIGSVGVRVRVGIYVPLKNPYPWQGSRVSTWPKNFAYINLRMVFFFYFSVQNLILNF